MSSEGVQTKLPGFENPSHLVQQELPFDSIDNPYEYPEYKIPEAYGVHSEQARQMLEWLDDNPDCTIHDMPSHMRLWLARFDIYTTTTVRNPPRNLKEWYLQWNTEKNLKQLGMNVKKALRHVKGYEGDEIADRLEDLFQSIDRFEVINVKSRLYNEGQDGKKNNDGSIFDTLGKAVLDKRMDKLKGTVYAEKTYLYVKKEEGGQPSRKANELAQVLQVLLASPTNRYQVFIDPDNSTDDSYAICINNYDEYANRQLGNALQQVRALEDLMKYKFLYPFDKETLYEYYHPKLGKRIETLPPVIRARIHRMERHYFHLSNRDALGYRIRNKSMEINGKISTLPLAAEISGFFPAMRDVFRPEIRNLRGGDHFNQEQNPLIHERLRIEDGIELTRDEGVAGALHPNSARVLSIKERLQENARRGKDKVVEWWRSDLFEKVVQLYSVTMTLLDFTGKINEVISGIVMDKDVREEFVELCKGWFHVKRSSEVSRDELINLLRRKALMEGL